ncbi:MAG TPA: phospholipase D-like domain-containing protein [Thermoanaerobaculia bacterium]|nr:phospholipase D-like domain-containing protein [Thermoanaerobaculia bacterium]
MRLRKRRLWRPFLRPAAGRKLPPELRADAVGSLAAALPDGLRDPGFQILLRRIDQSPLLEGNRVRACFRGPETFEAMRAAIDAARAEVLVESYIFKDDATGRSLLETFVRAVDRGVRVCVLADAFGSIATRRAFWNEMRSRGVEVRLFNPLFPHLLTQPFRDHRKILVVDCATGFTGGMNIGDEYGSGLSAHGGPWRDTHVKVDGPAAWAMATVFTEAWIAAGGSPIELRSLAPEEGGVPVLVLDSRPGRGHGETASALAAIVAAARKRLWITNAYFAPRRRAVRVLGDAARRGVDVRILLPGRSDVPLVRHAGHGYYAALLRRGVRVFEYQAAVLHAKTLVADDFLSVAGSTNLDFRSFHFNAECNLVMLDRETTRAFSEAFEADLAQSAEITPALWARRSFLHRMYDAFARGLGPFL